MNSYRKNTVVVGIFFLTAMAASLVGGGLIESILTAPDFPTKVSTNSGIVYIGVFLEFINAFAVIGIAVTLFPILKKHNESIALGYVGLRIVEFVFCIVSAIVPLILISLSVAYSKEGPLEVSNFQALGALLISVRANLMEIVIPVSFGLGAFLLYHILFHSKLIPQFISVWGLIGVLLILTLIFLKVTMILNIIFVLPIILNEIFLGIWLITKGFSQSAIISLSEKINKDFV